MDQIAAEALRDRISADAEELERDEIWVVFVWAADDGATAGVEIAAPDEEKARELLHRRYGDALVIEWLGPEVNPDVVVPWNRYDVSGDRELQIEYTSAPGSEGGRLVVEEQSDYVRVTIIEHEYVGGIKPMPVRRCLHTRLIAPLGDRDVIDGATGQEHSGRQ